MKQNLPSNFKSKDQTLHNYLLLENKIRLISSQLHYKSIERINQVAFFEVQIKHTNQFFLKLGSEYFAEVRTQEALNFINRQKQNCQQEKIHQKLTEKINPIKKQAKNKLIEIDKNSYMELIGQENGQGIFNIVQIEGSQEISPKLDTTINTIKDKQFKTILEVDESENENENVKEKQKQKQEQSKHSVKDDQSHQNKKKEEVQNEIVEKSGFTDSEEEINEEESEEEEASGQEQEQCEDLMQEIRYKIQKQYKNNRKSSADQELELENSQNTKQTVNIDVKPDQSIKVGNQKEENKKTSQLPEKISKFKLEKMKEKLKKEMS